MMNLLSLTYDQLVAQFQRRYNKGAFHAGALYKAFYHNADFHWEILPAFIQSPQLKRSLQKDLKTALPPVMAKTHQEGVTKLVFGLTDGFEIETVVIPMANHATVCISCQVGCRMKCRFCQTGQMGLQRNLTAEEIVAQVYMVKVRMGINVRNVVLMGMGEPLDNFEEVVKAIAVLEDQRGLDIAKRHITLSTVGLPRGIKKLARLNWPQLKLAVSLNAPNDTLRSELMPVNRQYPMNVLKEVLTDYPLARGNALFVEYVLIKGINDHPQHARQLANYIRDLPVKLNLIPYNPRRQSPYQAPTMDDIRRFHQALIDENVFVRLRSSKGAKIRAACGQLGSTGR